MQVDRSKFSCFSGRAKCLLIGYLHLISSLVDIGCHLLIVSIVTGGFQCDVDISSLSAVNWPWLQPVLLFVNLGTHGFYPLPMILLSINAYVEYMPIMNQPKCYPGMLHVHLIDILNFLFNVIWLRLVISFIAAVHKRDGEQMRMFFGLSIMKLAMRMFFGLSIMKLAMQVLYLAFRVHSSDSFWFLELLDICIAAVFLIIIKNYIKSLRAEKAKAISDQPPSYIECLISSPSSIQTEVKKESNNAQPPEDLKKGDSPAILPI